MGIQTVTKFSGELCIVVARSDHSAGETSKT